MRRILGVLAISVSLLGLGACTPSNLYQGFQAIDASPNDVKVGTDNRSTVQARLGTPTATDSFDKNTWFYLTQISNKTAFYHPRVVRRNVVAITFDNDTQAVTTVNIYGLRDGRVIAYNDRITPTRGRELTILEQLFGNLSSVGTLPSDDNYTPGTHPGDTP